MYRLSARAHALVLGAAARLRRELGQGTVEYVALILLVALVMAGVVATLQSFKGDQGDGLGRLILTRIQEAVEHVKF